MTPIQMQDTVLTTVGEPEGIFHTRDNIRPLVQQGEQLLGMLRATTEKTISLPLVYAQPLYPIHSAAPDFIFPLGVSILKKRLFHTTLARITDKDRDWAKRVGYPQFFFMVGSNAIGVYPLAPSNSLTASLTYVCQPPVPLDTQSYLSSPEWHEALAHYASALLLAKEQLYEPAGAQINLFLTKSGLPRDSRFGPAEVKGSKTEVPLHPTVEPQYG